MKERTKAQQQAAGAPAAAAEAGCAKIARPRVKHTRRKQHVPCRRLLPQRGTLRPPQPHEPPQAVLPTRSYLCIRYTTHRAAQLLISASAKRCVTCLYWRRHYEIARTSERMCMTAGPPTQAATQAVQAAARNA